MSELTKIIDDLKVAISWSGNIHGLLDLNLLLKRLEKLDEQLQLNDNQKIVLKWLMEKYTVTNIEPIELIWRLKANSVKTSYRNMPAYKNYRYMTRHGQAKVLQIFSQWVLEQEEAE